MPTKNLKPQFRHQVSISKSFADVIDKMIEPDWEKRYQNAKELKDALLQVKNRDVITYSPMPVERKIDESFDIREMISLDNNEEILWSGRPRSGLRLGPQEFFIIPFSIFWTGFALFWEFMAITMGAPFFFALFGLPFVLIGFYLLFGRFFVEKKMREKTFYALTSKRLISISGLRNRNVQSTNLENLPDMNMIVNKDGSGSLTFGNSFPGSSYHHARPAGMTYQQRFRQGTFSIDMIENVEEVYRIISDAKNKKLNP